MTGKLEENVMCKKREHSGQQEDYGKGRGGEKELQLQEEERIENKIVAQSKDEG